MVLPTDRSGDKRRKSIIHIYAQLKLDLTHGRVSNPNKLHAVPRLNKLAKIHKLYIHFQKENNIYVQHFQAFSPAN